ncbi:hypothetical protein, partial [Escherichia coli]|uniref:hypothetical protein n=1 Tax=Escherichia coli TaxID=562 RepID=UPI002079AFAD
LPLSILVKKRQSHHQELPSEPRQPVTERRDLGLDDGSFWPVLEGIPATEMFNVIPLAPGHAYGMFMERFNELSELRKCA